ncbi:DUF4192 family protein [Streptomyces thioluteus]|uniref:DUF4192 family protein n=1 Tax=Streptomyces thioluteus TaxID=66431 RepID=UPI003CD0547A
MDGGLAAARHPAAVARALARRCVPPYSEHAAAPLTLAGWVAWASGEHAEAKITLGRALTADPDYLFAPTPPPRLQRGPRSGGTAQLPAPGAGRPGSPRRRPRRRGGARPAGRRARDGGTDRVGRRRPVPGAASSRATPPVRARRAARRRADRKGSRAPDGSRGGARPATGSDPRPKVTGDTSGPP